MNKRINPVIPAVFLTFLIFQSCPSYADGTFSLTSGADYSTGKYGQSQSTDISYVPFTAKYETDDTTLKLTIPWLQITGPGDVVGGDAKVVLGKSSRPSVTQSGLGDIVFSATHTFARIGTTHPLILDVTGKIKFATASASKGLGTGENDYSILLDAYKPLIKDLTLFGGVGYKLMGDPAGLDLHNVWFGSAGFSYKFSPATSAGIMADIRQATLDTTQPLRELTAFAIHKFDDHYKLQSYLTHGYSESSTGWGGGVMLGYVF
ncbi:MAG: hypothetical protein ABL885_13530 [Methylophilaceae bacterium]